MRRRGSPTLRLAARFALALAVGACPGARRTSADDAPSASPPEASVRVDDLLGDPERLLGWTLAHAEDVRAARARLGQAQAALAQSRLPPNPSLAATLSDVALGATNPPGLRLDDTAIFGITLSQTVEVGKRGPRIRAAQLHVGAGREAYLDAAAEVLGRVRLALGRVAYGRGRLAALEENLADARQALELQRTRLDHGDLSGNDYDRLLLDTSVLESDFAQSRAEYRAALEDCTALLYAACDAGDAGLDALDAAAPVPALDPGWEQSLSTRPDLQALALEERSAREDASLAHRRVIPDPSLSVGYTRDKLTISGDQPRTLLFGVQLGLPLFDRGQHDAAVADLRAEELHRSRAAALARARADVRSLVERRATAEASLAALRDEALPRSKRILDSTVAAVGQGELSMTDLLLARRTHADLVLKVAELRFGAFSLRNELRQALGLDAEAVRASEGGSWERR